METFELIFKEGLLPITINLKNEPIGYDAIDFHLNQEGNRYGRDWSFVGDGNVMLEFTKHAHYEAFLLLERFYNQYGFEADVKLKITVGEEVFIGNLDFLDAEYNGHDHFKFNINQETEEVLLKKRSEIGVDMKAYLNLDDWNAVPLNYKKILLPSKEIYRQSIWENRSGDQTRGFSAGAVTTYRYISNHANTTVEYDIKNTLNWLPFYSEFATGIDDYPSHVFPMMIEAATDLNELEINFDFGGSFMEKTDSNTGMNAYVTAFLAYGNDVKTDRTLIEVFKVTSLAGSGYVKYNYPNKTIVIPKLETGQKLWFWFNCVGTGQGTFYTTEKNIKIQAKAYEQTFDIVTECANLYDVVSKVVKDSSGLDTVFPMATTGVLKNTYLFTGNMIRGNDKPFVISFDDIKKWLPELNLDYEIMHDKKVYFGKREDYYTDNEIDVIDNVAFDDFTIQQNERYALNKFVYKYNKYQSQKENTEEDTNDIIHGEAEYHIHNKQVETTKTVEVNFVRDPFMIQETINVALTESNNKATQDDNTVFIIEAASTNNQDVNKEKTSVLYHRVNTNDTLSIQNGGNFNWEMLGFEVGSAFYITSSQNNGSYSIISIQPTEVVLQPTGMTFLNSSGEFFTKFMYKLNITNVSLKPYLRNMYLGEIEMISGIKSPETFANINRSVRLNINYYIDFLSTAAKRNISPNLIKYFNNQNYVNKWISPTHKENSDITLKEPILSTNVVTTKLIIPFERYLRICRILRSENRGFVRTFDTKGEVICLYPQEMTAVYKTSNLKEVTITGELKNMPKNLNITKRVSLYNLWVLYKIGTYSLPSINYSTSGDYITFLDTNLIPIYTPLHYSNVKINNNSYSSINALESALDSF